MTSQKHTKLNMLIKNWPKGTIATQNWLDTQDISRQLTDAYCQTGWLERVGYGAYIQAGDIVDWYGGLFTLQQYLGLQIHAAAVTALGILGLGHYVPMNDKSPIWLFIQSHKKKDLPKWFFQYISKQSTIEIIESNLFNKQPLLGLIDQQHGAFNITISSAERAIMEIVSKTPLKFTFEYTYLHMENLRTLRPSLVQELLENCSSIKTKRLFLYLAETQNHEWFKRLDLNRIDLGNGARKIGNGGKYIAKYKLSIPVMSDQEGFKSEDIDV